MTPFRVALSAALVLLSGTAMAQEVDAPLSFGTAQAGSRSLWFSAFLGLGVGPAYFGSDETELKPAFSPSPVYLNFGARSFGTPEFRDDPHQRDFGFGLRGSFRYIGVRNAEDHDDLTGLDDVDPTLEVGVGLGYTGQFAEAFADLRYGIGGSDGWVGELGANLVARPSDRLALRIGPRVLYGSDNYADAYFGITADESARSGLAAFDPDAGLISTGVEFKATYRLGAKWWLEGGARYERFQDDAADSPITREDDNTSVHIGLRRAFVLEF